VSSPYLIVPDRGTCSCIYTTPKCNAKFSSAEASFRAAKLLLGSVCAVLKPFLLPLAVVCVSELGELIAHLCRESRDQQGQLYMYKTDRTIEIK